MSTISHLNELVNKYYWYTVDHRNIHIKLIVKALEAKTSYGKERIFVVPVPLVTRLIQIPQKGFWVETKASVLEPIEDIHQLIREENI